MATLPRERAALDGRYETAIREAAARGAGDRVRELERSAGASYAVIARSLAETEQLAAGDHNLYATYHQQLRAEIRIPDGSKWDLLRTMADSLLFGEYAKEVRFGALSLDGRGLESYGDCFWVLREEMISHRSSVFEQNSVIFMNHHPPAPGATPSLPPGFRAEWSERGRLSVAKLAARIEAATSPAGFQSLLLRQGATSEDDDFIEVHVGGPMTVRTLDRVILRKSATRQVRVKALRAQLGKMGVTLEVA